MEEYKRIIELIYDKINQWLDAQNETVLINDQVENSFKTFYKDAIIDNIKHKTLQNELLEELEDYETSEYGDAYEMNTDIREKLITVLKYFDFDENSKIEEQHPLQQNLMTENQREQLPQQIEEKLKEDTLWQQKQNDDKNTRLKQLEEKLQLLLKIPKTQGQFPSQRNYARGHVSRRRYVPPVEQNISPAEKPNSSLKKMEELIKNDPRLKERLIKFLEKNKTGQFYINATKRSFYISRPKLNELREKYLDEKDGGFLPLIPILAGIAAAGSVAGGAAGIASAVNKKKAEDAALAEAHRHNISLENAARGKGLKDDVVKFVQDNDLDEDVKRLAKKTLKGLASVIPMRKEGSSLILSPYKRDGSSLILNWK